LKKKYNKPIENPVKQKQELKAMLEQRARENPLRR